MTIVATQRSAGVAPRDRARLVRLISLIILLEVVVATTTLIVANFDRSPRVRVQTHGPIRLRLPPGRALSLALPPLAEVSRPVGMNLGGGAELTFGQLPAANQAAVMRDLVSAGVKWLRIDVPFSGEENSPGQFNWYALAEVRQAVAHGIQVDALLSYAPSWANLADGSPNPAAFAGFARAAAGQLLALGVHTYEIWNEPNLSQNWASKVSPVEYSSVLEASYPVIKAVDPGATVLAGGFSPAADAPDGSQMSPITFLTQMYQHGVKNYFDALADHPYSYPDLPQAPDNWNPFYNLPQIRQLMQSNGDGSKQIWLTEYGAPTTGSGAVTPLQQSQMISEAVTSTADLTWIGPIFLFDWQDNNIGGGFGITNADGTPKPAYTALTQLTRHPNHPTGTGLCECS